jgi:hypothetical protein
MMIKRWPSHIPHLPHHKITIYGWSTSPRPSQESLVRSYLPAVEVASRMPEFPVTGTPAGTVAVRAYGLRVHGGTVTAVRDAAPQAGELAVFCRPVVTAPPPSGRVNLPTSSSDYRRRQSSTGTDTSPLSSTSEGCKVQT